MALIALSGGIGSGKSVVARILGDVMGWPVMDSDRLARHLMNTDPQLRRALTHAFGDGIYHDNGTLDAPRLAATVFDNPDNLSRLNNIVHPVVCEAVESWARAHRVAFVETALPVTSGLRDRVDRVWMVVAPDELRCRRVMERNGLSAGQVMQRIEAQRRDATPVRGDRVLLNDEATPLLPQVLDAVKTLQFKTIP